MPKCTMKNKFIQEELFSRVGRRKIKVDFNGGNVSSDGGLILLKQVDRKIKLLRRMASILKKYDTRQQGKVEHDIFSMLTTPYGVAYAANIRDRLWLRGLKRSS